MGQKIADHIKSYQGRQICNELVVIYLVIGLVDSVVIQLSVVVSNRKCTLRLENTHRGTSYHYAGLYIESYWFVQNKKIGCYLKFLKLLETRTYDGTFLL